MALKPARSSTSARTTQDLSGPARATSRCSMCSGQELYAFPTRAAAPWFVGFVGPDEGQTQALVVAGIDGQVALWQLPLARLEMLKRPPFESSFGRASRITSVVVSPDGAILAAASDNRTVKLWDARYRGGDTGWPRRHDFQCGVYPSLRRPI